MRAVSSATAGEPTMPNESTVSTPARPSGPELGLSGIVQLAIGYQRAQVLFTANALGVFSLLASGPRTASEVAAHLGCAVRGVTALLDACVRLGLLRTTGASYQNSRSASLFLVPGRESSYSSVLSFWQRFSYGVWGRLEHAVRENAPQTATGSKPDDLFDSMTADAEQLRLFFDGLAGLAYWPANRIADAYDFAARTHLLDLGGGSGAFSTILATRHLHLRVTLFDLEPVCKLARERFTAAGLDSRARAVPGDFHHDRLPTDCDSVLVANVLHDWSPDECVAILERVHAALPPGGEILIHETMPDEAETPEAPLFSLALLLDTQRGRAYRFTELQEWLERCEFQDVRRLPIVGATGLVVARKKE